VKPELEKAADNVDSLSRLHMYIHEPSYHLENGFTWETFLQAGSELAESLARLSEEVGLPAITSQPHQPHNVAYPWQNADDTQVP
jgi:hypothetical protein